MEKKVSKRKALGQHFLMHERTAARIAEAAGLLKKDTVFEIGPGEGILTDELLKRAGHVIALELDERFVEALSVRFAEPVAKGKLTLIRGDIRTFDLSQLPERYAVVANIPYYVTGMLLRKLLSASHKPESMTLLVQKEVADRVVAAEGKESLLSLSVKAYGVPKRLFTVPKGAFVPPPKVDSAVLSIRSISAENFHSSEEERRFFELLHAAFLHKRKYVATNLKQAGFSAGSIPEKARAEDIPLPVWLSLLR